MRNLGSQSAINIEVSNTDDVNSIIDEIIKANKNVENSTKIVIGNGRKRYV